MFFPTNAAGASPAAVLELGQNAGATAFTANTPNAGNGVNVGSVGFNNPQAVVVDQFGHVYVTDNNNNRVLGWANEASLINGAAPDKVFGQMGSFTASLGNDLGISADSLKQSLWTRGG